MKLLISFTENTTITSDTVSFSHILVRYSKVKSFYKLQINNMFPSSFS